MKKQRKMTTIAAGIAMVALTAASLGTATFAWFTRGTEAAATGFDFTASAAQGIQISADAVNFKTSIAASEFQLAQPASRVSVQNMEPVSTINTVNNTGDNSGEFNFWLAEYVTGEGDGSFNIGATRDTTNYLVFDIYLQNPGAIDQVLRLRDDSFVRDDSEADRDTALATRVGFVLQGNDEAANVENLLDMKGGVDSVIWEPNSLTRSSSALAQGATNNAKYPYHGLKGTGTGILQDKFGTLVSGSYSELVSDTVDMALGDSGVIATLPAESVTKLTVFIWIEGQDMDCNNATSSGAVDIDLRFDAGEDRDEGANHVLGKTPTYDGDNAILLSSDGTTGALYKVFVVKNYEENIAKSGATDNVTVRYLVASGEATHTDSEPLTTITVTFVPLRAIDNTYDIIVRGLIDGKIEFRNSVTFGE